MSDQQTLGYEIRFTGMVRNEENKGIAPSDWKPLTDAIVSVIHARMMDCEACDRLVADEIIGVNGCGECRGSCYPHDPCVTEWYERVKPATANIFQERT